MQGNLDDLLKEGLPPELARMIARRGVKLAIDLLQTLYADLGVQVLEQPAAKKLGRPRKKEDRFSVAAKSGWPADPEERKREMARRMAVHSAKVGGAPAKSGWPDDPGGRSREMKRRMAVAKAKARGEKLSNGAKKRWDNMNAAQKETWLRNMQRGKKRATKNAKTEEDAAA